MEPMHRKFKSKTTIANLECQEHKHGGVSLVLKLIMIGFKDLENPQAAVYYYPTNATLIINGKALYSIAHTKESSICPYFLDKD